MTDTETNSPEVPAEDSSEKISNDEIRQRLKNSTVASADFSVTGDLEADFPTLIITGKVLGIAAATLIDRICDNFEGLPGDMVIDLSGCQFFSSVALGFIVALADQRKKNNGHLILQQANRQIQQVIFMMDMGDYFIFTDSAEDTLKHRK